MQRRDFIHGSVGLALLPLLSRCKHIAGSDSQALDVASEQGYSDQILHNMRYDGIPITTSKFSQGNDFGTDAETVRSQLEQALNSGAYSSFRVRGGGHSYIGASVARNAYVLNMAPFSRITIDQTAGTIRYGAGCVFYQLTSFLANSAVANAFLATGDCPTVGAIGYHLGGGQSLLSPMLGLGVDRVVEATIIVAGWDGSKYQPQILTISPSQNADLFWACMGGSGYFGVVTDLTLRYAVINDGIAYDLQTSDDGNGKFRNFFQNWDALNKNSLAPETSSKLQLNSNGSLSVIGIARQGSGDIAKLQALASKFGASFSQRPLSLDATQQMFSGCHQVSDCSTTAWTVKPQYTAAKSTLLSDGWSMTAQYLDWLAGRIRQNTKAASAYVQFARWSGANRQANAAVSFPHRNFSYECQISAGTGSASAWGGGSYHDQWVDQCVWFLGERNAAFFNHVNAEVTSNKGLYFGPSWPRLQSIKATYDPKNVFEAFVPGSG